MHISTTTDDYIYIMLGFVFGMAVMANICAKRNKKKEKQENDGQQP
jgi:hypothetical protein